MYQIKPQKSSGFTLVELVIVMALSALILLLVFLALPAGQRAQRDSRRKTYVQTVATKIERYKEVQAAPNLFSYPNSTNPASAAYFKTNFDPSLGASAQYAVMDGDKDPSTGTIYTLAAWPSLRFLA